MNGEGTTASRDRGEESRLLAAILFALLFLHLFDLPGAGAYGIDGSYYYQLARHVAAGDGLVTSVSLYHQGLNPLPSKSNIYPLWPLLLGWTGKLTGLVPAANFLPRVFYVVDLLLFYLLARGVVERSTAENPNPARPVLRWVPHLLVVLLGMNLPFFQATAVPFTDGLGLALLFAALLSLREPVARPLVRGLCCGALAGLAFLTRSQLLLVIVGAGAAIGIHALHHPPYRRLLAGFILGVTLTVLPWIGFLSTFIHPLRVNDLIGMHQQTTALEPFNQRVPTSSLHDYLLDRLGGVLVAFNPATQYSFAFSFGPAAYLPLLAAAIFALRFRRGNRRWPQLLPAAMIASGFLLSAVLLSVHTTFFLPWLFGYRHGIPYILLIAVSVPYLLGAGSRSVRLLTILVMVLSLVLCTVRIGILLHTPRRTGPSPSEAQLAEWLDARKPLPTVLTTNAQSLSVFSRANFHWTACTTSSSKTRRMLDLLPIDYVIVYEFQRDCPFAHGLDGIVRPLFHFGTGPESIYVLERLHPPGNNRTVAPRTQRRPVGS